MVPVARKPRRRQRFDMMGAQRQKFLEQALQLSRLMAQLGASGEWQQVIDLEAQRRVLLENAFRVAAQVDTATTQQIQAILAVDKQLLGLGIVARDETAAELCQLQRGRKVKQAYDSVDI